MGRVALVSGASRGIGRAVVDRLLHAGAALAKYRVAKYHVAKYRGARRRGSTNRAASCMARALN